MELADLTRGMQKNNFLEPEKLFFAKLGLSEFHESSAGKKNIEPVFLQSQACLNFIRLVCKKNFFRSLKNCFSAKPRLHPIRPSGVTPHV